MQKKDQTTAELERHYAPSYVAKMLDWNVKTVRRHFESAPGTLRFEINGRVALRIPASAIASFQNDQSRG